MGQGNVPLSMSNTKGTTYRVFGITEDPHAFAARNAEISSSKGFGNTSEFRCVVAAGSGSSKRRKLGITRNWITKNRTKLSGEAAASLQPANSPPSTCRLESPSVKSLQPGDSIPVIVVVVPASRQHKILHRLGQPERFRSELIQVTPKHIPRQTQRGHHLNSAIREFSEIQTRAPMGAPQVESRDKRIQ